MEVWYLERYSGSDNWSHTLSWNSVPVLTSNTLSSYNVQAKYPMELGMISITEKLLLLPLLGMDMLTNYAQ